MQDEPAKKIKERGDFGAVVFDDRDTFGIIKAILKLREKKQ